MDFDLGKMGFDNLFIGDFNALKFSVLGLLIVFCGLAVISLYIAILPKLLDLQGGKKKKTASKKDKEEIDKDSPLPEVLVAIAIAIHLDQTYADDNRRITWQRHDAPDSPWQAAGRVRALAIRSHLSNKS